MCGLGCTHTQSHRRKHPSQRNVHTRTHTHTHTHIYIYISIRREVHPEWAPLGAARMREMIDGELNLFAEYSRFTVRIYASWRTNDDRESQRQSQCSHNSTPLHYHQKTFSRAFVSSASYLVSQLVSQSVSQSVCWGQGGG